MIVPWLLLSAALLVMVYLVALVVTRPGVNADTVPANHFALTPLIWLPLPVLAVFIIIYGVLT